MTCKSFDDAVYDNHLMSLHKNKNGSFMLTCRMCGTDITQVSLYEMSQCDLVRNDFVSYDHFE